MGYPREQDKSIVSACYYPLCPAETAWSIGSFSTDDGNGSENVTSKMSSHFSNFSSFIPIRLKCQKWANFPGVDFLVTALKFRKRKKNSSSLVYVLHKT